MRRLVLVGLWLGLIGCGGPPPLQEGDPGTLSVVWDGREQGRFLASMTAEWCATDSMVELLAMRGDTGVGLALFGGDTVRKAMHPVLSGDVKADWRPVARAAVRWVGSSEVVGYEGTGGVVNVTATDTGLSGTLDIRLRSTNGVDTLHLTGAFTEVPTEPAVGVCGRRGQARRDSVLP